MKKSPIAFAFIAVSIVAVLSGCSSPSSPTGTKSDNGREPTRGDYAQLIYSAIGTVGDGADDASIVIKSTGDDVEGLSDYTTILPWSMTSRFGTGNEDNFVSLTVSSLSSDGSVSCAVTYQNVTIKNTATGDHPVAVCEGTMTLD